MNRPLFVQPINVLPWYTLPMGKDLQMVAHIRPSRDSVSKNARCQDFLGWYRGTHSLLVVLNDGVSQSFYGDFAAWVLGEFFFDLLQKYSSAPSVESLLLWGKEVAQKVDWRYRLLNLPTDIAPILRQVLEEKRALGSETMFAALRLDLPSSKNPQGHLWIVHGGNIRVRLRGEAGEEKIFSLDESIRWSSQRGFTRPPTIWETPLRDREGRWLWKGVTLYSDGMTSLDSLGLPWDLRTVIRIAAEEWESPISDDQSFVEIEWDGIREVPDEVRMWPISNVSEDISWSAKKLSSSYRIQWKKPRNTIYTWGLWQDAKRSVYTWSTPSNEMCIPIKAREIKIGTVDFAGTLRISQQSCKLSYSRTVRTFLPKKGINFWRRVGIFVFVIALVLVFGWEKNIIALIPGMPSITPTRAAVTTTVPVSTVFPKEGLRRIGEENKDSLRLVPPYPDMSFLPDTPADFWIDGAWDLQGEHLVVASLSHLYVYKQNGEDLALVGEIPIKEGRVHTVGYFQKDEWVLILSKENKLIVKVFSLDNWRFVAEENILLQQKSVRFVTWAIRKPLITIVYDRGIEVWAVSFSNSEPKRIWRDTAALVRTLSFSPDGETLVYSSGAGKIMKVDMEGQNITEAKISFPVRRLQFLDADTMIVWGEKGFVSLWRVGLQDFREIQRKQVAVSKVTLGAVCSAFDGIQWGYSESDNRFCVSRITKTFPLLEDDAPVCRHFSILPSEVLFSPSCSMILLLPRHSSPILWHLERIVP